MMKTSTTFINSERSRYLKRTSAILDQYKELNDALYYLSHNLQTVRKNIREYTAKLNAASIQFVIGDGRSKGSVRKLIKKASAEFLKALSRFDIKTYSSRSDKLITAVIKQQLERLIGPVNTLGTNLETKAAQFNALSEAAKIPTRLIENVEAKELITALKNGQKYYYKSGQLKDLWSVLTKRYGAQDRILYGVRQGKSILFPMRSWIDMRTRSTAQDVHNNVMELESATNGILTGKISAHGSKDSCIYHENRIFFWSNAAKEQFLKEYPEYSEASSWPTIEDIRSDDTHMFKPNCIHRTTPYPFYLFGKQGAMNTIKNTPAVNIPDNPERAARKAA